MGAAAGSADQSSSSNSSGLGKQGAWFGGGDGGEETVGCPGGVKTGRELIG